MMKFLHRTLLFSLALSFYTSTAIIAEEAASKAPITIEMVKEHETIQKGTPFSLLLHFKIDDQWHTYWKNPGDLGMPISINWDLPEGFKVNEIHWPTPDRLSSDSIVGIGYEKELFLLVNLTAPENVENPTANVKAQITWLACSNDMCLPGKSDASIDLLIKDEAPKSVTNEQFEKLKQELPKISKNLSVEETSGFIHLKVTNLSQNSGHFTKAYFFPEEQGFIDHKVITHFDVGPKNEEYLISLKREDAQNFTNLKGVLVLLNEKEGTRESIAIDVPLNNQSIDSDEIAFLSKSEIEKQILDVLPKSPTASEFEGHFEMALLFAFVGGMILNLMPCVLPVLSLKIFSFVKMSGKSRKLCFQHGLSFSLGVLISFWALAGVLLILQAYGESVGWGFQLQEPIFVAILASVIFVLGLNLFGVMEVGTSVTSAAGSINHNGKGLTSSFLSGVLATALATPCTGPFLGSAVGYAVTLPAGFALLIFTMLGTGMAFPYLLLSAYPSLLRFIPKPGNWMITFKEIMGFLMMATTIWLLFVFVAQTDSVSLIMLLGSFFLFGISCWIYGKWATPLKKKTTRVTAIILSLIFLTCGAFILLKATNLSGSTELSSSPKQEIASDWEPFSPQRITELQAQGIPVFVDFTAKWCLICQTNHISLSTNSATKEFEKQGVVRMKADWTKKDAVITEELAKFGRNSVPLYVLYGKNSKEDPKVLPQVLTSDIIVDYLKEL